MVFSHAQTWWHPTSKTTENMKKKNTKYENTGIVRNREAEGGGAGTHKWKVFGLDGCAEQI